MTPQENAGKLMQLLDHAFNEGTLFVDGTNDISLSSKLVGYSGRLSVWIYYGGFADQVLVEWNGLPVQLPAEQDHRNGMCRVVNQYIDKVRERDPFPPKIEEDPWKRMESMYSTLVNAVHPTGEVKLSPDKTIKVIKVKNELIGRPVSPLKERVEDVRKEEQTTPTKKGGGCIHYRQKTTHRYDEISRYSIRRRICEDCGLVLEHVGTFCATPPSKAESKG